MWSLSALPGNTVSEGDISGMRQHVSKLRELMQRGIPGTRRGEVKKDARKARPEKR